MKACRVASGSGTKKPRAGADTKNSALQRWLHGYKNSALQRWLHGYKKIGSATLAARIQKLGSATLAARIQKTQLCNVGCTETKNSALQRWLHAARIQNSDLSPVTLLQNSCDEK